MKITGLSGNAKMIDVGIVIELQRVEKSSWMSALNSRFDSILPPHVMPTVARDVQSNQPSENRMTLANTDSSARWSCCWSHATTKESNIMKTAKERMIRRTASCRCSCTWAPAARFPSIIDSMIISASVLESMSVVLLKVMVLSDRSKCGQWSCASSIWMMCTNVFIIVADSFSESMKIRRFDAADSSVFSCWMADLATLVTRVRSSNSAYPSVVLSYAKKHHRDNVGV